MYDELVKRMREPCQYENCVLCQQAADAIEERDKYALSLQHEMMAEAESHIALVERLNKQIEELSKSRWIPVTEQLPIRGDRVICFGDNGINIVDFVCGDKWCALPWFYLDGEQETGVTHWMPLPEPPKEEA